VTVLAHNTNVRTTLALALLVTAGLPRPVSAQDVFKVEYICGKPGFDHNVKGQLALTDTLIRFVGPNDSLVFAVPFRTLGDAFSNAGGKTMLGFCTNKGELVFLYTEAGGNAEAIAFKTERGLSSAIVARIQTMMKALPAAPPDR
jgi:hypothetical protein